MDPGNPDMTMVVLWLGARITGLVILVLMILWGVFNGQFKNMQKGRYIALDNDSTKPLNGCIKDVKSVHDY